MVGDARDSLSTAGLAAPFYARGFQDDNKPNRRPSPTSPTQTFTHNTKNITNSPPTIEKKKKHRRKTTHLSPTHPIRPRSHATPKTANMPRGPEIPLTIRHVAIAYFFDLEMRQTDICNRLGISKQSLSVLISRTRERCPSYQDPEKAGPTPEELNMLCAAAAVKQRCGRPRRADGGGRCSHCGAPRLRTKKAKKAAAEFAAKLEAAKKSGEPAPVAPDHVDGDDDEDGEGSDDGEDAGGDATTASAQAPPPPAPTGDDAGRAAGGHGGGMYLPPITTPAPSTSSIHAPTPAPTAYPAAASPYPPAPMAGVSMVNGIVSQGGGSWFYGNNGWEMYGRRDVGSDNTQVPGSHNGDFNRQY